MKHFTPALLLVAVPLVVIAADGQAPSPPPPVNPAIDMEGYLRVSREAAQHRRSRRLTEAEFLWMSAEPGTIVLDARSQEKYDLLHVKGRFT